MVLEARQKEHMEAAMSSTPQDEWDETPEMVHLRERIEDPKTDGETAEVLLNQYRKLAQARMAYYSS